REGQTFYVQTVTKVQQSLVVEDPKATRAWQAWARGVGVVALFPAPLAGPLTAVGGLAPLRGERDREVRQNYEHTSYLRYTVKKKNKDGSAVLTQQVVPGRNTVKSPLIAERIDATLDGGEGGVRPAELTLHVDARGV